MLDGVVVREAAIGGMFVRVDGGGGCSRIRYKAMQRGLVRPADRLGHDLLVARSLAPTTTVLLAAGPVPCLAD